MAKRNRELRLLERRAEKKAKKAARKLAADSDGQATEPAAFEDAVDDADSTEEPERP